jgi:aryl-alcohol dehydrogenase-like predicted oxidoreductase
MEYRPLGRTGVQVSALCLGTAMFGPLGNPDHDDCARIVHRALDAGVNFVDTADQYGRGEAERILGKALRGGRREHVVLSTKVNFPTGDDPNQQGQSRRWIVRAVEDSLRRLGTDWIDLYHVHRHQPDTDLDETLGALSDLVHAGKVRMVGTSNYPAHALVEAQWVAARRGHVRPRCEQLSYSLFVRRSEGDVLPVCRRHGMGAMAWSPLDGGWLSGRYRVGRELPTSTRAAIAPDRWNLSHPANQRKVVTADKLARLAEEAGLTLIQLALAFVVRHPAISAAIIGPRTEEHLESQLAAQDVVLSTELLDRIDELVPPGQNATPYGVGWPNPALDPAARRR